MERNNIILSENHSTGQNRKNGALPIMFFPVKNVIAKSTNAMQHSIENIDIRSGCHSKSYLEVSLKYEDMHQKKLADISMLKMPKNGFLQISIFLICVSEQNATTITAASIIPNTIMNQTDSTKLSVMKDAAILRGTTDSIAKIIRNHMFFKFNLKTSVQNQKTKIHKNYISSV